MWAYQYLAQAVLVVVVVEFVVAVVVAATGWVAVELAVDAAVAA